jgi:hypothetical protein
MPLQALPTPPLLAGLFEDIFSGRSANQTRAGTRVVPENWLFRNTGGVRTVALPDLKGPVCTVLGCVDWFVFRLMQ